MVNNYFYKITLITSHTFIYSKIKTNFLRKCYVRKVRTNNFSLESLKKLTFSFMKILQEIVIIFLYMVNFT